MKNFTLWIVAVHQPQMILMNFITVFLKSYSGPSHPMVGTIAPVTSVYSVLAWRYIIKCKFTIINFSPLFITNWEPLLLKNH